MKVWGWVIAIITAPFLLFFIARGTILLATHVEETHYPPPGRMVSVGSHRLHLYCIGRGSPTVVLEPGMGMDWVSWRQVSLPLAAKNEVCMYDRGGYGWSDAGPLPRTAVELATELHSLLSNASVPGPYLLVAHSFGGYIARIYASRFGETLSGVVMVDALQEENGHVPVDRRGLRTLIPPLGSERLKRLYQGEEALPPDLKDAPKAYRDRFLFASSLRQLKYERNEFDSLPLTEVELQGAAFPSSLPLTVITAGRNPLHWERQARLAGMSESGKHVRAEESGHAVQLSQPDVIVEAVEEMIRKDNL
jgi:pimeloyl-ACP methyl ester carboxylesterase